MRHYKSLFITVILGLILGGVCYLNLKPKNHNSAAPHTMTSKPPRGIASTTPYCLLCQFPAPKINADKKLMCEDLFKAACERPPQKTAANKDDDEEKSSLEKYRDKAAQQMGYKDFEDGLKKRLKEAGLEVNSDLNSEEWGGFVESLHTPASENDGPQMSSQNGQRPSFEIFKSTYRCQPNYTPAFTLSKAQLQKEAAKLRTTFAKRNQKIQGQMIQHYAKDLPTYLEGYLFPKCEALNRGSLQAELNQDLAKICRQSSQIKREVIMLYREEGTPEYQKKAEDLIRRIWVTEPVVRVGYGMEEMPLPLQTTKNPLAQEVEDLNSRLLNQCLSHQQAVMTSARTVGLDYINNINRSKTVVEGAIGETYTPQRKKQIDSMFETIRADVQALVPQLTSDKKKQSQIIDEYNDVKLFWMDKPGVEAYGKNAQGLDVLKPNSGEKGGEGDPNTIFSDPSLSFFSETNAYYSPQMTQGRQKKSEHVQIFPGYLNLLETNPYGLVSILAHEAGHKIGPELSKINGHDMREDYKNLLACYKDRKSIRMQDQQADEVIADYISSEVMASHIAKLPEAQRRPALLAVASAFCENNPHSPVNCKAPHPESMFRVNGILAANPNMRKVVGCSPESPNFKTCGIKNVSLVPTDNDTNGSLPSERQTQDADEEGGVE